ncbi:MAG: hypothetical protein Q8Q59_07960 [Luteolibacter sp.]|nr:hypothetical protein [Luteolibacter sp.]
MFGLIMLALIVRDCRAPDSSSDTGIAVPSPHFSPLKTANVPATTWQGREELPDLRPLPVTEARTSPRQLAALEELRAKVPGVTVDFDPLSGAPSNIVAVGRFLFGTRSDKRDAAATVKEFLNAHADLFGNDSSSLEQARITREDVGAHNGMHTLVWQQEVDGIPLYRTILRANVTKDGELISLGSHFLPDAISATGLSAEQRSALIERPPVDVNQAVTRAAANLGDTITPDQAVADSAPEGGGADATFQGSAFVGYCGTALLAAFGCSDCAIGMGRDPDESQKKRDVPRVCGCEHGRSAGTGIPDPRHQQRQLPCLCGRGDAPAV